MTNTLSTIQQGSTLISDHKLAVEALESVLAATTAAEAKATALSALQTLGELAPPILGGASVDDKLITR